MTGRIALQSTTLREMGNVLRIELVYADHPDLGQATASVVVRLPIAAKEHPIFPDARSQALHSVRRLVNDEILELERSRGRV